MSGRAMRYDVSSFGGKRVAKRKRNVTYDVRTAAELAAMTGDEHRRYTLHLQRKARALQGYYDTAEAGSAGEFMRDAMGDMSPEEFKEAFDITIDADARDVCYSEVFASVAHALHTLEAADEKQKSASDDAGATEAAEAAEVAEVAEAAEVADAS